MSRRPEGRFIGELIGFCFLAAALFALVGLAFATWWWMMQMITGG